MKWRSRGIAGGIGLSVMSAVLVLWFGLIRTLAAEAPAATNLTELSFEQLLDINVEKTSTASRYEQTLAQAPASVSVVTRDEIKKTGSRNLAEVLSTVRGFYMAYDRNYTYIGSRGFSRPGDYNSRMLVLVDGQRINDGVFDQAAIGNDFPVDLDLVERVEVVRGPSSAVYGNNAFFGVINVITRRGAAINGVEASLAAGSWNTWQGRFTYGEKFKNDLELLFSGSFLRSEGQSELYYPEYNSVSNNVHNGIASHMDGEFLHNYRVSVSWQDWELNGLFSHREKTVPTGSFGTDFNDPGFQTIDQRAQVGVKFHHVYREQTEVTAKSYFDDYTFQGDYPTGGVIPATRRIPNCGAMKSRWRIMSANIHVQRRVGASAVFRQGAEELHASALQSRVQPARRRTASGRVCSSRPATLPASGLERGRTL